jgi:hypothetical protein
LLHMVSDGVRVEANRSCLLSDSQYHGVQASLREARSFQSQPFPPSYSELTSYLFNLQNIEADDDPASLCPRLAAALGNVTIVQKGASGESFP